MNAKSKKTLKAAAVAAGLVAVLLPTGCSSMMSGGGGGGHGGGFHGQPAPGLAGTVVAPLHIVVQPITTNDAQVHNANL